MATIARRPELSAVKTLLESAELPSEDLTPGHIEDFLGAHGDDGLVGVIGLERYGGVGLLRSLAVVETRRGTGLGKDLVAALEAYALKHDVREIWLLTTTADRFFSRLGYAVAARDEAPAEIRGTVEFSTLCPASSVVMRKRLAGGPDA